jgi:hypothetical protein
MKMERPRTSWCSIFRLVAMLSFFVLALCEPSLLFAQGNSGSINGTVTDPSGEGIAGASVIVTNVGTDTIFVAKTSDLGAYTIPKLPVGKYELCVKVFGFKRYVAEDVEVHTSTTTEVNARLALGAFSETVTVDASDVQVQISSSELGEIISGTQLRELPLNGENFMGLVVLSPGVSPTQNFNSRDKGIAGGADFSVNGNPSTYNLFFLDGVNNTDVGSNRTILIYPSVDSIAEFKMLRNSYGPEYGQAAGAIISISTRSGENGFHGGLFYAGRNDALDAYSFFSKQVANPAKAELRRNDWGYHFAGPIVKKKLFFWWNQEWNREVRANPVSSCVPTAAERSGDFTVGDPCNAQPMFTPSQATMYLLPGSGTTLPNGNIRGGVLANPEAAGQLLLKFYPEPNQTTLTNGRDNWADSIKNQNNWNEYNVRIDYEIAKRHHATFRYTRDTWENPAPNSAAFWGDSIFPAVQSDWSQPSRSLLAKLSSQLSAAMVNDLEFGYAHNAVITSLAGETPGLIGQVNAAIPAAWPTRKNPGLPVEVAGFGPYGNYASISTVAPYGNHMDLYTIQDNLSKVYENHTFRIGALYSTNAKNENNFGGYDQPSFDLTNVLNDTGNTVANALLPGQVFRNVAEQSTNPVSQIRWHDFEFYAGDTWKLRRNLTITLGFRLSLLREPYANNNQLASWSLANYDPTRPAGDACNGVIVVSGTDPCGSAAAKLSLLGIPLPLSSGTPGPNRALQYNANNTIAPRVGVAWDITSDGKTALRLGAGQFFQRERVNAAFGQFYTSPFVINVTENRTLASAGPLSNPSVSPNAARDPASSIPNSWQWNVSFEREIARDTTFEVGYVGNSGVHLTSGYDQNRIPESGWLVGAFTSGAQQNALRPAGNFGSISTFNRQGHSSYNALQILFRSKWGNLNLQASYTWSHSISDVDLTFSSGTALDGAFSDPSDTGIDKGNSTINRPQIFVANEVYYLPRFQNRSALVRDTLGGWEVNSIITAMSGASMNMFLYGVTDVQTNWAPSVVRENSCATSGGIQGCALQSLTGTGFRFTDRPNAAGANCGSGSNGYQVWNPKAITLVGFSIGSLGTAPRGMCFGPDLVNVDIQFAKNWTFKERFRLKLSIDAFNLFNHTQFRGDNGFNQGITGNVNCGPADSNAQYRPCGPSNRVITRWDGPGTFGQATTTRPAREFQYGLKLTF